MSFYKTGTYLTSSISRWLKHVLASILEGRAVSFVWITVVRSTRRLDIHLLGTMMAKTEKNRLVSNSVTQSWYSLRNLGKFKKLFDEILLGMTVLPPSYKHSMGHTSFGASCLLFSLVSMVEGRISNPSSEVPPTLQGSVNASSSHWTEGSLHCSCYCASVFYLFFFFKELSRYNYFPPSCPEEMSISWGQWALISS